MPTVVWVVAAVAVVALIGAALVRRNRSPHSSVDSFRRQIDALGPAARRTVVDQVQTAAGRDQDDAGNVDKSVDKGVDKSVDDLADPRDEQGS